MKRLLIIMFLSIIITLVLPFDFICAEELASRSSVCLGVSELTDYSDSGEGYDDILLGSNQNGEIKWRVLSKSGNGGTYVDNTNKSAANALFVLSERSLDNSYMNYYSNSTWKWSSAQNWCTSFADGTAFMNEERGLMLYTSKGNDYNNSISDALENERIFFLSPTELDKYITTASKKILKEDIPKNYFWWLRAAPKNLSSGNPINYCTYVNGAGYVTSRAPTDSLYYRPAMNLNSDAITLISAVETGKNNTVGVISKTSDYSGNVWRLTIYDSSYAGFCAELTSQVGNKLVISYSNSKVGSNQYVSAVITKGNSEEIKYYGKLKNITDSSDTSGIIELTLPDDYDADNDKLFILQEECYSVGPDISSFLQKIDTHKHSLVHRTFGENVIREADYWLCEECGACFRDEGKTQPIDNPEKWQETMKNNGKLTFSLNSDQTSEVLVFLAGYDKLGKMIYLSPYSKISLTMGVNEMKFAVNNIECNRILLMLLDTADYYPICQAIVRKMAEQGCFE